MLHSLLSHIGSTSSAVLTLLSSLLWPKYNQVIFLKHSPLTGHYSSASSTPALYLQWFNHNELSVFNEPCLFPVFGLLWILFPLSATEAPPPPPLHLTPNYSLVLSWEHFWKAFSNAFPSFSWLGTPPPCRHGMWHTLVIFVLLVCIHHYTQSCKKGDTTTNFSPRSPRGQQTDFAHIDHRGSVNIWLMNETLINEKYHNTL